LITSAITGPRRVIVHLKTPGFAVPVHCFVYARHGHELMRCKSSVGESPYVLKVRQLLVKDKGVVARRGLKEVCSKAVSQSLP
ncbi:MAG: hypothetical protein ACYTGS_14340, partial [Planctomycetota bacterium]